MKLIFPKESKDFRNNFRKTSKFGKKTEGRPKCIFAIVWLICFVAFYVFILVFFSYFWFPLDRYWFMSSSLWGNNCLFKVNNGNTSKMCEISSQLTINTPERRHWRCSRILIVNFEQIFTHSSGVSIGFEQVNAILGETKSYSSIITWKNENQTDSSQTLYK